MSTIAKVITFFLGLSNAKKLVEKSFKNPPRSTRPLISSRQFNTYDVSEFQVAGKSVVTLQPKVNVSDIHLIFFHGGAYVIEGNAMQWKMIETIISKTNCKISYVDYPLAPEYTYINTFDMVQQSYDILIKQYPDDRFMLLGDSAGGGLALAFAQKLVAENAEIQPDKIILFSPWLDLSMQNPGIRFQETLDKLLPLQGLIYAGKKYAGGDNTINYLLSPINGNLSGLGKTVVFYGSCELFCPDCQKLKEKTRNNSFTFHEFAGMQHDWVILPIPEAKQTIEMAVEFIKE